MTETVFETYSAEETAVLGRSLAGQLEDASVVALYGELGAGKTAFVSGLAEGFECLQKACSPTYAIVNEYYGRRRICHFDMYRISDPSQLYDIGWEDYLDSGALCVVEWSENIEDAIPEDAVRVYFEKTSENGRRIKVKKC